MKITITLLFIFTSLFLVGCQDPDIKGNAFIVKSGGDVKPAAGRTVYLIPEKSETSLFSRAINEVAPVVRGDFNKTLKSMCPKAIEDIEAIGSIAESGCKLLKEEEETRLNNIFKSAEVKYLEKIENIKSKLKELETKRADKVKIRSAFLKKEAFAKVRLILESGTSGPYYDVELVNNTDYCVKNRVKGYVLSKGIIIGIVQLSDGPIILEDEFGFKIDECIASPNSKPPEGNAVMKRFLSDRVTYKPNLKRFAEKNGLPVDKEGYLLPDKIITTDVEFGYKPVKSEYGDIVKYSSETVSFLEIASREEYTEDQKISEVKKSLNRTKNKFENDDAYIVYFKAKSEADACNTTFENLSKATDEMSTLNRIETEVDACLSGQINTEKLSQAFIDLDRISNTSYTIPDINLAINVSAKEQAIKIMTGESSRRTDTTIDGHFTFKKVPKGNYLLYSEYQDSFVRGFWLTPIIVKENAQFDLNNNTFKEKDFNDYLAHSILKINR